MQRSFVAKTTVNFPDHELYVRVGDTLVYNAANDNSLTVYRAGAIIKTIKTTPISIAAMLKTKMILETGTTASKPSVKTPPVPSPAPKATPKPKSIKPKDKPCVVPKSRSEAKRISAQMKDPQIAVDFLKDNPAFAPMDPKILLPEESK